MLDEEKNIKDTSSQSISIKDTYISGSFSKTTKLITALYMVTDIVNTDEPLREKLRSLGTDIISDIHTNPARVVDKIDEILSFLGIASTMHIISEMNCNILKKEFLALGRSIKEFTHTEPSWLEEFLRVSDQTKKLSEATFNDSTQSDNSTYQTRIGVQKGSTLMKALSDKTHHLANKDTSASRVIKHDFDVLKKERRFNIIKAIKGTGGNPTIKDIKLKIKDSSNGQAVFGEKTLQRELVSMIKDGVLSKQGEKRWTRYFIKN